MRSFRFATGAILLFTLALAGCKGSSGGGSAALTSPENVTAVAESTTSVRVSWDANNEDVGTYLIERADDDNGQPGTFAEIGKATGKDTSFLDSTVEMNKSYWYRVRAERGTAELGAFSNFRVAKTGWAVDLDSNFEHAFAIHSDGTVWAWGYNNFGQLGDGTTLDQATPVPFTALSDVMKFSTGDQHTVALRNDGTVWAWGRGSSGQLGDGLALDTLTPVQVPGMTNVVDVQAGDDFTLAVKSNGTVWAWGANWDGQLGDGTGQQQNSPVQITALTNVSRLCVGEGHSFAIMDDGTVYAWGSGWNGKSGFFAEVPVIAPREIEVISDVVDIQPGGSHSIALKADGTVWAWGANWDGQLGNGKTRESRTAVQVVGLEDVVEIHAGDDHNIAVKSDGTLWGWGDNFDGQLATGDQSDRFFAEQLNIPEGVRQIHAAEYHTLYLMKGGVIMGSGENEEGQLGTGQLEYTAAPSPAGAGFSDIIAIAAGDEHGLLARADGTVWGWGDNDSGQIWDPFLIEEAPNPFRIEPIDDVVFLEAGERHSLAIRSDGTGWAWGEDWAGQLGNGFPPIENNIPSQIVGLTDLVALSAGPNGDHSLALKSDGTVYAFGYDWAGQLGNGAPNENEAAPQMVGGIGNITAIAAGEFHSLALQNNGDAWAWGRNNRGQLGDATNTDRDAPVLVGGGGTNYTAIAAGSQHSLALRNDGTVWAWGYDQDGQLGDDNALSNKNAPVQVAGITNAVAVAAGRNHSFAVLADGSVMGWGYNYDGQVGDGTIQGPDITTPVPVINISNPAFLTAGYDSSFALMPDGTMLAWGNNEDSQLGNGFKEENVSLVEVLVPNP